MKILIVGAGAVGQVYGFHLQRGGAEVAYLVREKHAREARAGFTLFPLNRAKSRRAQGVRWNRYEVLTSLEEVAARSWDQVHLCISSTGLRGPWLEPFLKMIGETSTLVSFQPLPGDLDYLLARFPRERLVLGMIGIVSYLSPEGTHYWFPPLSPSFLDGPRDRAAGVRAAYRAGRAPFAIKKDLPKFVAFPGAVLLTLVQALENADWSLAGLSDRKRLKDTAEAVREACAILGTRFSTRAPFAIRAIGPTFLKAALAIAPRAVPFDLEPYLKAHFTKVGDQTRLFFRELVADGEHFGKSTVALRRLAPV
jgi:ketopantoate reductase